MCESDDEVSDFDIEKRSWNKLEKNIKVLGFQEGAAKGRDLSLQEGFNMGYMDGFKIGEQIGMLQARQSLQNKEEYKFKDIKTLSSDACALCKKNQTYKANEDNENESKTLKSIISEQQTHSIAVLKSLEDSKLKSNLEKG